MKGQHHLPQYCSRDYYLYNIKSHFPHQWTLRCFHVLPIENNATVNIGVQIYFWVSVSYPLDKYLEMELPDNMVAQFLICEEPSYWFSVMAITIYIPINSELRFPFLTNACSFCLFDISSSNRVEFVSLSFDLYFSLWCWAPFHVHIVQLCIIFGNTSIQILCPFLKIGMFFLFLLLSCKFL